MVLDARAMEWAAENGIDSAKLKAAKIPIYGKWYFPDVPADVPLVNLQNGHIRTFKTGLRAGEILFVPRDDLRRARLGPYAVLPEATPEEQAAAKAEAAEQAREPVAEPPPPPPAWTDQPLPPGEEIHLPGPSIYPLIVGLGLSIALLGLAVKPVELRPIILLLGLVYLIVGGAGWAVEGQRERDAAGSHHGPETGADEHARAA